MVALVYWFVGEFSLFVSQACAQQARSQVSVSLGACGLDVVLRNKLV